MITWFDVQVVADLTIAAAYLTISLLIIVPLARAGHLRSNKLGAATAGIFFSCSLGHGLHALHMLSPGAVHAVSGHGMETVTWWLAGWHLLAAGVALYYLSLRRYYGRLMVGAPLFDDLLKRRRLADLESLEAEVDARAAAEAERDFYATMMSSINQSSQSLIYAKDLDGRYLWVNAAFVHNVGLDQAEVIGRTDHELFPEHAAAWRTADLRAREGHYRVEECRVDEEGRRYYYDSVKFPMRYPDGTMYGICGVSLDITGLKKTNRALVEARDAALAAGEAKSAFLATMSHEIRTPMNAVIGMTDLLLDTPLNAQQQDFVSTIRSSGDTLLSVIDDILDFSKIESGSLRLSRAPFRLREEVEKVLSLVAVQAAAKDLDLVSYLDDCPVSVVGDAARLRQILLNLLSNAVKFTHAGDVLLTVTSTPTQQGRLQLAVTVADTGIGISPQGVTKLFTSFSQVDTSSTRAYGGTGLGLAISQRLARAMGGDIAVSSTPGGGSTFSATLLLDPDPAPTAHGEEQPDPTVRDKSVLIVDDNATNLWILDLQLTRLGMATTTCTTPLEALRLVEEGGAFDLAVLDLHMPELNGIELANRLREHDTFASAPLVLLTSVGDRPPSSDVHFAAVITKPVKSSALHGALQAALRAAGPSPARARRRSPAPIRPAPRPLRILLAEDNAVNQRVASLMLGKLGHQVDIAQDGVDAVQRVADQAYDVVLMDIQMPRMDGLTAARRIRSEIDPAHQPEIIAMTASALLEDQQACAAAGMTTFLTKPVRAADLKAALDLVDTTPGGRRGGDPTPGDGSSTSEQPLPAIDAALIEQLQADLEDDDGTEVGELIDTYLDSTTTLIPELTAALTTGRTAQAATIAHALTSGTTMVGARPLADLLHQVREVRDHPERAVSMSKLIATESRRVSEHLRSLRRGRPRR